ncbi:uncharacterized protein A4U43_UnF4090 [Asparagus officinalis]|uniref:Disease resistance R13L4/SHOC-2-like LRR domain-containing protein n=1 Tax=Asparagus officinalis TaxID=4686 RepID=A0A1R3L6Y1_ASPOF|nr:uncharacterized protein A4U43_UnF4090 [Asparagus officinalis]
MARALRACSRRPWPLDSASLASSERIWRETLSSRSERACRIRITCCRVGTRLSLILALGSISLAIRTIASLDYQKGSVRSLGSGHLWILKQDLGNLNLSGHLVPELGNLEHLQYLELYKNNLQGVIPSELGNLESLISLDLYNNNISGTIPPSFGRLKSLVFLRLNNNQITGQIPRELVGISSLKVVDVSSNNLCGTVPSSGPFAHIPLKKKVCACNMYPLNGRVHVMSALENLLHPVCALFELVGGFALFELCFLSFALSELVVCISGLCLGWFTVCLLHFSLFAVGYALFELACCRFCSF